MLAVLGSVGIGLVWGWMLSHPRRSWRVGQALRSQRGKVSKVPEKRIRPLEKLWYQVPELGVLKV